MERDPQILGFVTFLFAGVAVTHRHPFDQPEAEQSSPTAIQPSVRGHEVGSLLRGGTSASC